MKKQAKILLVAGLCAAFAIAGVLATPGVEADSVVRTGANNLFTGNNQFPNIKIGAEGVGGVTYFNGSIVNATTTDGNDNPVTFADDLRIDGKVWRGPNPGPGDDMPFIIDDDVLVNGDWQALNIVNVDGLQDALDGKVDGNHSHDGYISEVEVNSLLSSKASSSHDHNSSYVSKSDPTWDEHAGIVTIHPSDCVITDFEADYQLEEDRIYPLDGADDFYCNIDLPHGAVITGFKNSYYDTGGGDIDTYLYRSNAAAGASSFQEVATIEGATLGGTEGVSSDLGSDPLCTPDCTEVDNDDFAYTVKVDFGGIGSDNLHFRAAKVYYDTTGPN
ncbi:hypothetical protein ACFL2B_00370 [Patescibacteria group bacterium]